VAIVITSALAFVAVKLKKRAWSHNRSSSAVYYIFLFCSLPYLIKSINTLFQYIHFSSNSEIAAMINRFDEISHAIILSGTYVGFWLLASSVVSLLFSLAIKREYQETNNSEIHNSEETLEIKSKNTPDKKPVTYASLGLLMLIIAVVGKKVLPIEIVNMFFLLMIMFFVISLISFLVRGVVKVSNDVLKK
jgi:hypothetical protein